MQLMPRNQNNRAIRANRLQSLLLRHTRPEDVTMSDRDFVQTILDRWKRDQAAEIVDVNE